MNLHFFSARALHTHAQPPRVPCRRKSATSRLWEPNHGQRWRPWRRFLSPALYQAAATDFGAMVQSRPCTSRATPSAAHHRLHGDPPRQPLLHRWPGARCHQGRAQEGEDGRHIVIRTQHAHHCQCRIY